MSVNNADVVIDGCAFNDNNAPTPSDGVVEIDGAGAIRLTDSTFDGNIGNELLIESPTAAVFADRPAGQFVISPASQGGVGAVVNATGDFLTLMDLSLIHI